jgi:hypothetical protein
MPTRDDLIWASAIFDTRVRVNVVSGRVYAQANGKTEDSTLARLHSTFGGALYAFGVNVLRWQIGGEALDAFATAIRPFLGASGLEKLETLDRLRLALHAVHAAHRRSRVSSLLTQAEAPASGALTLRVNAFTLLDGVDEDQLNMLRSMPDAFEHDAEGSIVLRALTFNHAAQWSRALQASGLTSVQRGLLIYVFTAKHDEVKP